MNPNVSHKILLVHLVANGDCLMATSLAKQIKVDYPGCFLIWAISFKCSQAIRNNPWVDEIREINYRSDDSPFGNVWHTLKSEIEKEKYYKVFYSQIYPDNEYCYDGTTRSSTFNTYPTSITVPITPVFVPEEIEIKNAAEFAKKNNLLGYDYRILFECTPSSGQSDMNLEKALQISMALVSRKENLIIIISTHVKFSSPHSRIIGASDLSFRENVPLSFYCNFLIGCSSGISWLLTTDSAKKLNTVQILNKNAFGFRFASMIYDFKYWNLNIDHILETPFQEVEATTNIIEKALIDFPSAVSEFSKKFTPGNEYALYLIFKAYNKDDEINFRKVIRNYIRRNGINFKFIAKFFIRFVQNEIQLFSKTKKESISR